MSQYPYQPPQQGYPGSAPAPAPYQPQQYQTPPQQPYQQQAPQYAPQQPQAPAGPPPVQGTLEGFYGQPTGSYGPSISWKGAPDGTSVSGVVARDVTDSDVRQQTDPQTQQLKFYRDGRPQLVMIIPLDVQASQTFPEGTASLWVQGAMRTELERASKAAGREGAPKAGDRITVTLTGRKPGRGSIPKNEYRIEYDAAGRAAPAQEAPEQPQQFAQGGYVGRADVPTPAGVPQGLTPEQRELLAKLQGGQ